MIKKDSLSPGDRILYNKKTGYIMFKRSGKPFVLSHISSSVIFIGLNCTIDGVIKLIDVLLHIDGLWAEIKKTTDEEMEVILHK